MADVFIGGVAQTVFGKDSRLLEDLLADVGDKAIKTSSSQPDIVLIGNYNYQGYAGQASLDTLVGNKLKLPTTTGIFHINRGSSTGAAVVELAYALVKGGKKVLVVSGEIMYNEKSHDRDLVKRETSKVIAEEDRAMGLDMPLIAALAATEYGIRHKIPEEEMRCLFFSILYQNRENGSLNPAAYFKDLPSDQEYFFDTNKNPFVARPLTKSDCAGTYNGAAAVFLTPNQTDLKLLDICGARSSVTIADRRTLISLDATVDSAILLFKTNKLNPTDIDIVELHDAFPPVPILAAEDLGIAQRGKGAELVRNGINKKGRHVHYNLSGGFLCKTHPIGASGTAQLVELSMQMRGQNQYKDMLKGEFRNLRYGLWFSMNGFGFYNDVGVVENMNSTRMKSDFDPSELPTRYSPKGSLLDHYIPSGKRSKIMGAVPFLSADGKYNGLGIATTPNGLRLGYISGDHADALGRRTEIIQNGGAPELIILPELTEQIGSIVSAYMERLGPLGPKARLYRERFKAMFNIK